MCPVCGTLLELAESPQATREKAFVEKLAKEGKTKDQIKDALVDQYGDAVLALPKSSGFSLSAYVVPIVGFVVAVISACLRRLALAPHRREARRPRPRGRRPERRGPRASRRRLGAVRPLSASEFAVPATTVGVQCGSTSRG